MTFRKKFYLSAAAILLLSVPILIYFFYDLTGTANDRQRCAAAHADFLKYTRPSRILDETTESAYCQRLENEGWACRYAAIILGVLGGYLLYSAFRVPKDNVP